MKWKKIMNQDFWKPETDGKEIEGIYRGMKESEIIEDGEKKKIYSVQLEVEGRGVISLPSHTVLNKKFTDMNESAWVKIVQLEEKKSSKNPKMRFMDYDVFLAED